jgi:hypothetical protein
VLQLVAFATKSEETSKADDFSIYLGPQPYETKKRCEGDALT